jgi:hypothetical protein
MAEPVIDKLPNGPGYPTGSGQGGTVTQITSRSTGVTLHTPTGAITTDTTSLGAELSADFTVTCAACRINDIVAISVRSGSDGVGTIVTVAAVANGSFVIRVHNGNAAAGGAETGAIIINYAVIKGQVA